MSGKTRAGNIPDQKELEKELSEYLSKKYGNRIKIVSNADRPVQVGQPTHDLAGKLKCELKTIQEVITLMVFAGFTAVYFKEPLSLTQGAGFALIALGAILVFRGQA